MTGVSEASVVERIARVLAAQRVSINADGDETSASATVDDNWTAYQADAYAILRTLREPDHDMVKVGDVHVWERMVAAALGTPIDLPEASDGLETGSAPFIEGP